MRKLKEVKDMLKPFGSLDLLYYYALVAPVIKRFLGRREIATKTIVPSMKAGFFLKRGSNSEKLYAGDLNCVSGEMLKLRAKHGLSEIREELSKKQQLVWEYFVPRKLVNFFYATNYELRGGLIDRIFIDIDRRDKSSEEARVACCELVKLIKKDSEFNKLLKYKIIVLWTGSSFHVYLLLKQKIDADFYKRYLSYGRNKEESFVMRWADKVTSITGINVKAGHEKERGAIVLDSSNTPSGKLARAPFSIHISDDKIDGFCVPVSLEELEDERMISRLQNLTAEKVLNSLEYYFLVFAN